MDGDGSHSSRSPPYASPRPLSPPCHVLALCRLSARLPVRLPRAASSRCEGACSRDGVAPSHSKGPSATAPVRSPRAAANDERSRLWAESQSHPECISASEALTHATPLTFTVPCGPAGAAADPEDDGGGASTTTATRRVDGGGGGRHDGATRRCGAPIAAKGRGDG